MTAKSSSETIGRWVLGVMGTAAASYAAYVGTTWYRYGKAKRPSKDEDRDPSLDRFLPEYEVAERHQVRVAAPADVTFGAACTMDMHRSRVVRAIFRGREWILRSKKNERRKSLGIVEEMKALGWGVLEEIPGREIVLGAVTRPWIPDVVFRALPPEEFAAFREPGYVKIVVTFRADPVDGAESIFRTETRVATTDPTARAKFRWYWSFLSPGIILIRRVSLPAVKAEAERQARAPRSSSRPAELEALRELAR